MIKIAQMNDMPVIVHASDSSDCASVASAIQLLSDGDMLEVLSSFSSDAPFLPAEEEPASGLRECSLDELDAIGLAQLSEELHWDLSSSDSDTVKVFPFADAKAALDDARLAAVAVLARRGDEAALKALASTVEVEPVEQFTAYMEVLGNGEKAMDLRNELVGTLADGNGGDPMSLIEKSEDSLMGLLESMAGEVEIRLSSTPGDPSTAQSSCSTDGAYGINQLYADLLREFLIEEIVNPR